jgi:hypothetical protein
MNLPTPPLRPNNSGKQPTADISLRNANKLLQLGIVGDQRPVDELIEFLLSTTEPGWLERALNNGPCREAGECRAVLLDGRSTLDQLRDIKDRSKRLIKSAGSHEERMAGIAGYLFAVAAAIVRHRQLIATRPKRELRPVLLDLATAVPDPWSAVLGKAAFALDELAPESDDSPPSSNMAASQGPEFRQRRA